MAGLVSNTPRPALQCFAVSTSTDATGTFHRYAFTISTTGINDYPKIGRWPDGYYMSFNIFGNGAAKVCSFDRSTNANGHESALSLLPASVAGLQPGAFGSR